MAEQPQVETRPAIELTEDEFRRVNHAIRMSEKLSAMEIIIKNALHAAGAFVSDPKAWVRLRPSARRIDVSESLHDAADKLRLIAQRLVEESEKVGV